MSMPSNNAKPDCKPPPKNKMAVLTFVGLLAPVYLIPSLLSRMLPHQDFLVTVIAVGAIVVLMTYIVMPALIWLFRGWLS